MEQLLKEKNLRLQKPAPNLTQRLTNHSLPAQSGLPSVFVNKALLEHSHTH